MGIEAVSIGKLSDFGPKLEGPLSTIVNEGPVGLADLKNTMPLQIGQQNPITAINFQSQPELNVSDVVAEAEGILVQAQIPQPKEISPVNIKPAVFEQPTVLKQPAWEVFLPQIEPVVAAPLAAPNIVEFPKSQIVTSPALEPAVQAGPQTENEVANEVEQATATQSVLEEQEVEEVVQEKVKIEEAKEGLDKEKIIKLKKYLVDQPVLETILFEADQAFDKAEKEAEKLGFGKKIFGARLAKLLPGQHEGNTGGAVKPYGFDGTIPARRDAIASITEFRSKKEVKVVILENRPVTIGENGEEARKEEVSTTFQGRIVKPPKVIEIVKERIVKRKKALSTVLGQDPTHVAIKQQVEFEAEPTIEELNPVLAEVFQKAAV